MLSVAQNRQLRNLISNYKQTYLEYWLRGGGDPLDYEPKEQAYKNAKKRLNEYLKRITDRTPMTG